MKIIIQLYHIDFVNATKTNAANKKLAAFIALFILLQMRLCQDRKWGTPNLRAHLPMQCRERRRFRGHPQRGHKHIRKDIHTFS